MVWLVDPHPHAIRVRKPTETLELAMKIGYAGVRLYEIEFGTGADRK